MNKEIIDDGGVAFPENLAFSLNGEAVVASHYFGGVSGLSKLDWFAGMALQGICSNLHCTPSVTFDEVSERAYQQAESMIKAMRKRK